jgi:hypothetical protein
MKNLENSQRKILITHQICVGECQLNLSIDSFEKTSINNFRNECKKCRLQKRKNAPTLPVQVIQEQVIGKSKICAK